MNRSALLTAFPLGVERVMWPEVTFLGSVAVRLVGVTELRFAGEPTLNLTRSFASTSKFVPEIAIA